MYFFSFLAAVFCPKNLAFARKIRGFPRVRGAAAPLARAAAPLARMPLTLTQSKWMHCVTLQQHSDLVSVSTSEVFLSTATI